MQASWRRLINQDVIGQLWPPRPQPVEHILLLLGLLTRTNWRGGKEGWWKADEKKKSKDDGNMKGSGGRGEENGIRGSRE